MNICRNNVIRSVCYRCINNKVIYFTNYCGFNFNRNIHALSSTHNKNYINDISSRILVRKAGSGPKKRSPYESMNLFDRNCKLYQRNRSAMYEDYQNYEYLREEVGWRIADRIFDIKREFSKALDLGCSRGYISRHMQPDSVVHVTLLDSCQALLDKAQVGEGVLSTKIVMDEETFELEPDSFDIVVSSLCLHWVNDLPGCFDRVINCLKKDGVFIAALLGGESLFELRSSLQLAELERKGGFTPRISPMTRVRDVGGLLNGSGFTMLTIDTDEIEVIYPTMFDLLHDLRGMGETGATLNRTLNLHRDTLLAASAIYQELYSKEIENQNKKGITATFQIIYMLGWKPDPDTQQQPLKPQRGDISFKDIDKMDELIKSGKVKIDKQKDKK